jgi:hypothetical protein
MSSRLLCALLLVAACDVSSTGNSDFGVVLPGCHQPNKCYAAHCSCNFALVDTPVAQGGCMVCDPNADPNGLCDCNGDSGTESFCEEPAQVCIGHGAAPCNGRCVHAGKSCDQDLVGDPPQVVASQTTADGAPPETERRCAFADDLCCAGDGG